MIACLPVLKMDPVLTSRERNDQSIAVLADYPSTGQVISVEDRKKIRVWPTAPRFRGPVGDYLPLVAEFRG